MLHIHSFQRRKICIQQRLSGVEYSCQDEAFEMEDNRTVTCQYHGQWSECPKCIKLSHRDLRNAFWYPFSHHHIIIVMEICLFK